MASTGAVKESQSTPEGKRTSAAVCADKTGGRRRAVRVGRQPISDQQKIDQKEGGGDISSARSLTVAERLRAKVQVHIILNIRNPKDGEYRNAFFVFGNLILSMYIPGLCN